MMTFERLVVGLLDISEHIRDERVARKYRDLTISWTRYDYRDQIIEAARVNEILDRAAAAGYQWCLILPYGHVIAERWLPDGGRGKSFFTALKCYVEQSDFLVAGSIIGGDGRWFGFEHGCLLVNLDIYQWLSAPDFDRACTQSVMVPKVEPRTAGPTIVELLPGTGCELRQPGLAGWNFVAASLDCGLRVAGFDTQLVQGVFDLSAKCPARTRAFAKYLETGIDQFRPNQSHPELGRDQVEFLRVVQAQARGARNGVFLWNIESYGDVEQPSDDFRPPVNSLYSVAAGFKPNRILHTHGLAEDTRVIYFDYSPRALEVRKYIVESWNGRDFPKFVEHLFHVFPHPETFYQLWDDNTPETLDAADVQRRWQHELDDWGGAGMFVEHWKAYQGCRHEYVCCNILTDPAPLFSRIVQEASSIIWWSNAFFTVYGNWFHTLDERRRMYHQWIEQLARLNPDLYLCGSDYNNVNVNSLRADPYWKAYRSADSTGLVPCRLAEAQIRM